MKFYVLDTPHLEEGQEPRLAVTDFMEIDPVNHGSALYCTLCGKPISMLSWLPPYRAELEFWGKEAGDIAFGTGDELLVSERFKRLWGEAGLTGLKGFEKVEIVRTRSYGKIKGIKPSGDYYIVRIARSRAAVDDEASGLIRDGEGQQCKECRYRGIVKRTRRIVLEKGTWSGEDVFYPRGTASIITSERYRDFHIANKFNNGLLIPAEEYSFDFYPWENR